MRFLFSTGSINNQNEICENMVFHVHCGNWNLFTMHDDIPKPTQFRLSQKDLESRLTSSTELAITDQCVVSESSFDHLHFGILE